MRSAFQRLLLLLVIFGSVHSTWAEIGEWNESDSMLYWMIDESNEIEFQYAVVYATTEDLTGRTWTKDNGYGVAEGNQVALPKDIEGGFAYETVPGSKLVTLDILTELGTENWSSYTFYIELMQWDDVNNSEIRVGVSATSTYEDLVSNNHVLGSGLTIPENLVVWAPQTSTVPEPSSGLLFLIGGALCLLRRRSGHAGPMK